MKRVKCLKCGYFVDQWSPDAKKRGGEGKYCSAVCHQYGKLAEIRKTNQKVKNSLKIDTKDMDYKTMLNIEQNRYGKC